jgi:hypothetical protein
MHDTELAVLVYSYMQHLHIQGLPMEWLLQYEREKNEGKT